MKRIKVFPFSYKQLLSNEITHYYNNNNNNKKKNYRYNNQRLRFLKVQCKIFSSLLRSQGTAMMASLNSLACLNNGSEMMTVN